MRATAMRGNTVRVRTVTDRQKVHALLDSLLLPLVSSVTGSEYSPAAALLHARTLKFMNLESNFNPENKTQWAQYTMASRIISVLHKNAKKNLSNYL